MHSNVIAFAGSLPDRAVLTGTAIAVLLVVYRTRRWDRWCGETTSRVVRGSCSWGALQVVGRALEERTGVVCPLRPHERQAGGPSPKARRGVERSGRPAIASSSHNQVPRSCRASRLVLSLGRAVRRMTGHTRPPEDVLGLLVALARLARCRLPRWLHPRTIRRTGPSSPLMPTPGKSGRAGTPRRQESREDPVRGRLESPRPPKPPSPPLPTPRRVRLPARGRGRLLRGRLRRGP